MAKCDNSVAFNFEDDLGRTYTVSFDQNEWVMMRAEDNDEVIGHIGMGLDTFERMVRFYERHIKLPFQPEKSSF